MPFKIVRNDITKMQVDAIVNTASKRPAYGTGTDKAVYQAAGALRLLAERVKIGTLEEGEVAITPGFRLPAKYIIHAASPRYVDGKSGEEERLRSCYRKSLELAYENQCKSMAFPLISTGNFGYPKEEGMRIAVDEIKTFLADHDMLVYLVVFDATSTELGKGFYPELKSYVDNLYVENQQGIEYGGLYELIKARNRLEDETALLIGGTYESAIEKETVAYNAPQKKTGRIKFSTKESSKPKVPIIETVQEPEVAYDKIGKSISKRMLHMSDTFQEYLMYLIEQKGYTNAEVYKRAIISKQLFSKIKVNPDYHPDKGTAMRLCVGAELNLDETRDLLARAGYALSPCDKRDIIFSFFIEHKIFDMIEIDIVLEDYGLDCFIE